MGLEGRTFHELTIFRRSGDDYVSISCRGQVAVDEGTLELLCARILAFGLSRLRGGSIGPADVEDLVQESMLLLVTNPEWAGIHALEDLVRLGIRIFQLEAMDLAGRKATRVEREKVPLSGLQPRALGLLPDEVIEARERTAQMVAAVQRLDPKCREILRLQLLAQSTDELWQRLAYATKAALYVKRHRCYAGLKALMGLAKEERQ
jgi:DNA-directed RNA polymerase specialized sigma24 family protein